MASNLAFGFNEPITNNAQFGRVLYDQTPGLLPLSSEAFAMTSSDSNSDGAASSSSYTLASDDSRYNYDTARPSSAIEDTGVENNRAGLVHGMTMSPSSFLERSGLMYVLALLMPLVSVNTLDIQWSTPSTIIRTTEILLVKLSGLIGQLRSYVRRLARDGIARDLFATAMDIVLVVYAIGFLFLSLYQATIFT